MSSTNKTSLGLNMWEASDKPVRQDFINDNVIIDEKVSKLEQDLSSGNVIINDKIAQLNSNLTNIGTYQIYAGNYTIIPVGSKEWMCNWFSLTPGTYLIGFTSQYTLGVDTFLKVTDSDPTKDTALYELLRLNSGSASKVINITNSKIVSVLINNNSSTNYTVYPDPGAFFVWTLRVK
jgi:hypothetical protein